MNELSVAEFEQAYDLIAEAIDQHPEDNHSVFLGKLCLALTKQLGSLEQLQHAIEMAHKDLPNKTSE